MKEKTNGRTFRTAAQELDTLLACCTKMEFNGPDSISRLQSLNRLAHEAAQAFLQAITPEEDFLRMEQLLAYLDCFHLNRYSLNSLEILTGQNQKVGFDRIKKRLQVNIQHFLKDKQDSTVRQQVLVVE